ncbi:VOC family protein [Streptomyces sp. NA04227]|uniref:VOC family protein n=1 Tax=Streptomyces sp. NA04227 TaxID=2742136 RepID=UPI001590BB33|nr:VOC family protein [Streptomyces sp. NA04227]QKW09633.1 VOC family protein [Streptomyces sp. NA04227]
MPDPRLTFTGTVLDAPNAPELAQFYVRLLGWAVVTDEPDWVKLAAPDGGAALAFQSEPTFVRPRWPSAPDDQQMQMHLDFEVDDLTAGSAHAAACGAELAPYQPQDDTLVFLDPAGHPFCLWVRT